MSLKSQFKTDKQLETKGIVIDYGETRITVARAGGANKKFSRMLDAKTKPYRRAIALGQFDDERANAILREVYSHTVILGWEENTGTIEEPKWESGISPEDAGVEAGDTLLPVTPENVMLAFGNLPDVFFDIQNQASASALFRAELNELAAGN